METVLHIGSIEAQWISLKSKANQKRHVVYAVIDGLYIKHQTENSDSNINSNDNELNKHGPGDHTPGEIQ